MIPEIPAARLHDLQRERGICSEPECEMPIAGWCATCNAKGPFKAPKWCFIHLSLHWIVTGARHELSYPYDQSPPSDWLQRLAVWLDTVLPLPEDDGPDDGQGGAA